MKTFWISENSRIAKLAAWKLGGSRAAIVIGRRIYLYGISKKNFLQNERWLRHELKHVEQYERYGFLGFLTKYIWHSLWYGYENCCFEKEARAAEDDAEITARYRLASDSGRG